jgi:DNA-binding transcriptional regulator LsrR (DeoR family)
MTQTSIMLNDIGVSAHTIRLIVCIFRSKGSIEVELRHEATVTFECHAEIEINFNVKYQYIKLREFK